MAEIVALSGQPFREVWDGMTWPDYLALNAFWKRWPPAIISLAVLAKLGPKSETESDEQPDQTAGISELAQLIGSPPPG